MPDTVTMQTLVQAIGWMLIHFLWQGCAIAAVFWGILRLARHSTAEFRYGWGLLACLAVAVVPLATLWMLLERSVPASARFNSDLPAITVLANGYGAGGERWLHLALEPAIPVIVGLWALGVALLSMRTLLGWWGARRLVRVGVGAVGAELEEALSRLKDVIGVYRPVRLLRSVKVNVPTVIGWIKPVILLPAGVITALPTAQLEMVLAHELAHIRRLDYLINLLQLCIETLFFYHPAVRWISRQVRQEREHCCDDLVVVRCGQPVVYARALTRLEGLRGHACSPGLAATGGDLLTRVSRIVQREAPRSNSGMAQFSLVAVMAIVAGLGAGKRLDASVSVPNAIWQGAGGHVTVASSLPSIGQGWSRHVTSWIPPDPTVAAARKTADAVTDASASRQPAAPEAAKDMPDSGFAIEAQGPFGPGAVLAMPRLSSLDPPQAMRREDIRIDPSAPIPGNVSVVPLFTVNPEYPAEALEQGIRGRVKLRFRVDQGGRATGIEVVRSEPLDVFDQAAIDALSQWTFQVNAGHDNHAVLVQAFEFAWEEIHQPSRRQHSKDCLRTGTRVCSRPYTDQYIIQFRPSSTAVTSTY